MNYTREPDLGVSPPTAKGAGGEVPALWYEEGPRHFDMGVAWWVKVLVVAGATVGAMVWWDSPVAAWVLRTHPFPDLADPAAKHGDIARELMWLEQWGQWTCSVMVILGVGMLDRAGKRRALAIAIGCLVTVLVSYTVKDLCGRTRPNAGIEGIGMGDWIWGGPGRGFGGGSRWTSFPSAHTTGAFALAVGLAWFYPRGRALFMTLATVTAVQRVLHGAHFVSDVIAGMGISVMVTRWTLKGKLAGRVMSVMPRGMRGWFEG